MLLKQYRNKVAAAARRRLVTLRRKRGFKPAMLGGIALFAACLVIASYAALFNRNNVTGHDNETHKAKKDTPDNSSKAAPSSSTAPDAAQAYPSSVLDLTNWKLTLPVAKAGSDDPQEIKQPQLNSLVRAPYFQLNTARNGVVFQAPAGGATTSHSSYPRSELREMTDSGNEEASWSDTSGANVMTIRQAITHLPAVKPQVVAGQIHDSSDDVIEIRLEGSKLFVEANDGDNVGTLDGNYQLGTIFIVQITAANGHIRVSYNGVQKVDYVKSGSGWYFKAGCYTQSNPSKGDSPNAYGEVVIYSLGVSHS